jgi:deoxyribodipyrimidine photo-lyase
MTTIVLFRRELRIDDHPGLLAAGDETVVPLFVYAPQEEGRWAPGGASKWWLHHSLTWLAARLAALGAPLVVRHGPLLDSIREVAAATKAKRVILTRRYEPFVHDDTLRSQLVEGGLSCDVVEGATLFPLDDLRTGSGRPYQVYTPFSKVLRALSPPDRPRTITSLKGAARAVRSDPIESLGLLSRVPWAAEFNSMWQPGAEGAAKLLKRFLAAPADRYAEDRDRPDLDGTSRLSPHLHFGEISPRRLWHTVGDAIRVRNDPTFTTHAEKFRAEVLWREFAINVLLHFPHTAEAPLRAEYAAFPWRTDQASLVAWQKGRTGYPIVDAGMRQLWRVGWMHNRVRMVVASFLVKHLLLPWQEGARWFWDTLVDADLANNSLGWQWSAGCGADAAPYFRVFNPVLQGEKFDADGTYVRTWVPELKRMPAAWIHKPWDAPPAVLRAAGVTLGESYPRPLVEHGMARERALEALARLSLDKETLSR